jgi:hypothetical protein
MAEDAGQASAKPGAYSCCLLAAQRRDGTEPREQPEPPKQTPPLDPTADIQIETEKLIKLTVVTMNGVVSTMCQLSKCSRSRKRS